MSIPDLHFNKIFLWLAIGLTIIGCSAKDYETDVEPNRQNVAGDATGISPRLTGTTIPDVQLRTANGDVIQLKEAVHSKPSVLIFYRGGWCPYCNKHLAQIQEASDTLQQIGYQILAISPDKPEYLKESMDNKELDYTLLSDSPMNASKAFGLAYQVDSTTVRRYKNNGMNLAERSGYEHSLLPVPAVFLVNTDGLITFQYVNPDYKTRIKPSVLMAAARAYHSSNK